MRLDFTREAEVGASPAMAWSLLRDVPRLSACIPGVSALQVLDPDRRFSAVVSDKLGPFRLEVPIEIEVQEAQEPERLLARLVGTDSRGQARVQGTLEARVAPAASGSQLSLGMQLEVLGRLAALGAAPMRRRADEIFQQFVRCLQAQLGAAVAPQAGAE